jgi:hypothetical protein
MKRIMKLVFDFLRIAVMLLASANLLAEGFVEETLGLQAKVQTIDNDLAAIERKVLIADYGRVEVFVSTAAEIQGYTLKSIALRVNGKNEEPYTYSDKDIASLHNGSLHPLWMGNISAGIHHIDATIQGVNKKGKPVENKVSVDFEKKSDARALEIKIDWDQKEEELVFAFKDWGAK